MLLLDSKSVERILVFFVFNNNHLSRLDQIRTYILITVDLEMLLPVTPTYVVVFLTKQ